MKMIHKIILAQCSSVYILCHYYYIYLKDGQAFCLVIKREVGSLAEDVDHNVKEDT